MYNYTYFFKLPINSAKKANQNKLKNKKFQNFEKRQVVLFGFFIIFLDFCQTYEQFFEKNSSFHIGITNQILYLAIFVERQFWAKFVRKTDKMATCQALQADKSCPIS